MRCALDDFEDRVVEGGHQALCEDWADAFDQARAQIFFHTFDRSRRCDPQERSAKLSAVITMGFPDSAGLNVLASCHRWRRAQQCDELVVPINSDSQDTEAAIWIVKSDALYQTRQWLPLTRVIRSAVSAKHRVTNLAVCAGASLTLVAHLGEMGERSGQRCLKTKVKD